VLSREVAHLASLGELGVTTRSLEKRALETLISISVRIILPLHAHMDQDGPECWCSYRQR
jgi:hypothetical protein